MFTGRPLQNLLTPTCKRHHRTAAFLAVMMALVVTGIAEAQETPSAAPIPQVETKPWSMHVGVSGSYEDNGELQEKAFGAGFGAGVSRSWASTRSTMSLAADASQSSYPNATGLDTLAYSVGVGASYSATRRLVFSFSDAVASGRGQDSQLLTGSGLVYAQTIVRTNYFSGGLTYDLSPRTQITTSLGGSIIHFGSDSIQGASTLTPRIAVTRQLTRTQTVGVTYGTTLSSAVTAGDVQGLLATWQAKFGPRISVSASGGVRPYKLPGQGQQYSPGGGVGFSARLGRTGAVSANYERAVETAYGLTGTHLSHRFGASYGAPVGRRLSADLSFGYGLNTYPQDSALKLSGGTLSAGAHYRLVQNLSVSAGYSIWKSINGSAPPVTGTRGSVSVGYSVSWR